MEKQIEKESKLIAALKQIFLVIVFVILGYFLFGQIFLAYEQEIGHGFYQTFSEGWSLVNEDGTKEEVEIPGKTICNDRRHLKW